MTPVTITQTPIHLSWRIPALVTVTLDCRRMTGPAHMRGLAHERPTALLQRKTKMMQRKTKIMWRKMTMLIYGEKPLCHPLPLCRVPNPDAQTQ